MEPAEPPARAPRPDPVSAGRLGLVLVLVSLSVFFAAGLAVFVFSHQSRPSEPLSLPPALWLSTLLLLMSGMAVEGAARQARRARLPEAGRWLRVSFILGLLFTLAQALGMASLLARHELSLAAGSFVGLAGLSFALVLIHAVHVAAGLVLLGALAARSWLGRLGPEHLPGVRSAATYWHFLEIVWVVLLIAFYAAG